MVFDALKCPFSKVTPLHFQFLAGTLDYMIICSSLVGYYATCNGYFIKPIYIN